MHELKTRTWTGSLKDEHRQRAEGWPGAGWNLKGKQSDPTQTKSLCLERTRRDTGPWDFLVIQGTSEDHEEQSRAC